MYQRLTLQIFKSLTLLYCIPALPLKMLKYSSRDDFHDVLCFNASLFKKNWGLILCMESISSCGNEIVWYCNSWKNTVKQTNKNSVECIAADWLNTCSRIKASICSSVYWPIPFGECISTVLYYKNLWNKWISWGVFMEIFFQFREDNFWCFFSSCSLVSFLSVTE